MIDRNSREFLIHYARVMLGEARARRGRNVQWMIDAAANARRQAMAARPPQGELFS